MEKPATGQIWREGFSGTAGVDATILRRIIDSPIERTELLMSHLQPGLDHRHRDKDGEISKKHGNTLVSTLRIAYGQSFAAGFRPHEKLADVLTQLDEPSLTRLVEDHEGDRLHGKIAKAS